MLENTVRKPISKEKRIAVESRFAQPSIGNQFSF